MMIYDYIIIGAGISGLFSSFKIPANKKVLIITKNSPWNSNSFLAQGGISVAKDLEDVEAHIQDTLIAGSFWNDKKAVEVLVKDGMSVIEDLIKSGLEFDKNQNGEFHLTKEGAHSEKRILHIGGDATGRMLHSFLLKKLLKKPHHQILDSTLVTDFLIKNNRACGVTVFHKGKFQNFYSKNLILASGGVGNLYKFNTNAKSISGEIQGLALKYGMPLKDMEMLQFHPTAVISKNGQTQLLSEALRGEGAFIIDENNERFLFKYDKRGELASRDIVSQAIFRHNKKVFLSISHFDKEWFFQRFPTISNFLKNEGFNLVSEPIPISPAFHYTIGGIETDLNGKVKNFDNIFAIGEIASTGVHGANRLASNSLLEAVVFANRAVNSCENKNDLNLKFNDFQVDNSELFLPNDKKVLKHVQELMWQFASIEREEKGLKYLENQLNQLKDKELGKITKLQIDVALEICRSALNNKKSIGVHLRID